MRFEDCICVGLIGSPHGVKGYVKVKHFTESHRGVTAYGEVFNDKMEKIILDFKGLSKNLGIYSIAKLFCFCNRGGKSKKGKSIFCLCSSF